jgi:hypothetical protein
MKKLLTILLAGVSMLAVAQKKVNLSRSIDDDGKTMTIRVSGTIDGKEIDYDRSFDVASMSQDERSALRDKVLDSLGAGQMVVPEPPTAPTPPDRELPAPPKPMEPVIYSASDAKAQIWVSDNENEKTSTIPGDNGYTKQVRFNPASGELFLKYKFIKKNEEFIYEKTVNAADKSEEDRQDIIDDFETEIELPGSGI